MRDEFAIRCFGRGNLFLIFLQGVFVIFSGWSWEVWGGDARFLSPVPGGEHPITQWQDWERMGLRVSYFNVEKEGEDWFLWFSAGFAGGDVMVRLPFDRSGVLDRPAPQFNTQIVEGYERDLDGLDYPILSRAVGKTLADGGAVVYGAIGPRYRGGASELYPALFGRSPEGEWTHLGVPRGDPEMFLRAAAEAGASVRCEGGGLVRLDNGRWRLYLHGFWEAEADEWPVRGGRVVAPTLLLAEADHLEGPWTYVRDDNGRPVNLLEGSSVPWIFPHVQRLSDGTFLFTGAAQWPPKKVFAAYSKDGVQFIYPADEEGLPRPLREVGDIVPEGTYIKALRGERRGPVFQAVASVGSPASSGLAELWQSEARWSEDLWETLWNKSQGSEAAVDLQWSR